MFINGTPHTVNIYREEDCFLDSSSRKLILKEGAVANFTIEAGTPLNALNAKTRVKELSDSCFPFLKGSLEFIEADPLPGNEEIVIVSNLYRSALKELGRDTSRVATVGGTVYTDINNPRPVGCLYLSVG